MNIIKLLFGVIAIFFATVSHATVIEVSYKGLVFHTIGNSTGYEVGDKISGSLFINTDLAPADRNYDPSAGYYYTGDIDSDSGFVTGYAEDNERTDDYVLVEDNYADDLDYFAVMDHESSQYRIDSRNYGSSHKEFYIEAADYLVEFIEGDSLEQNFKLNASDGLHSFFGYIYHSTIVVENDIRVEQDNSAASFRLTNLKVRPVPEPSLLITLGAGLAGLGFNRKLKRLH